MDSLLKFKGMIENVEVVKTGVSDKGHSWELIKVVAGGKNFTTFDNKYKGMLGQEAEFEYKEETRGEYKNLVIVTRRPQDVLLQDVQEKLDSIDKKLDILIAKDKTDPVSPSGEIAVETDDGYPEFVENIN